MESAEAFTAVAKKPAWRIKYERMKERMARDPEYRKLQTRKRNERRRRRFAKDADAKADFVQRKRRRIESKKKAIITLAKGTTCSKCNGTYAQEELHFHHRDPTTKLFDLSSGHKFSYKLIRAEMKKCDVLCETCHCELHNPHAACGKVIVQASSPESAILPPQRSGHRLRRATLPVK
jgi:hypothetical protein